jgi:hypothetical protein
VVLDDLNDIVTSGQPVPFQRLEQLRRLTRTAGNSIDADERRLAGVLRDQIDEYVQSAGAGDIQAGDLTAAQPAIRTARDAWSRMSKSNEIEDLVDRASRMKSSPAEALKSVFSTLSNNRNRMRMYTPEEQRMIRRIADGTTGSNALTIIGKLAPGLTSVRGGVANATNIAAGTLLNPALGVGMAAGGIAGRGAANRLVANRAEQLGAFMRGGREGMRPGPSQMPSLIAPVGRQAFMGIPDRNIAEMNRAAQQETQDSISRGEEPVYNQYGQPSDFPQFPPSQNGYVLVGVSTYKGQSVPMYANPNSFTQPKR